MREIPVAEFKEQCLAILERIDPDGVVITKRGKPIAKLIPLVTDSTDLIGSLRGKLKIKDDIISTGVRWRGDELIGATSIVHNVPLVTRDRTLRKSRRIPRAR
jgi:antitoxin (DNA-binding transcriptional repressor) of toxin-antitoxin stability system